jgi:hypothetical protein
VASKKATFSDLVEVKTDLQMNNQVSASAPPKEGYEMLIQMPVT